MTTRDDARDVDGRDDVDRWDARRVDATRARAVGDARARWVPMPMASTCDAFLTHSTHPHTSSRARGFTRPCRDANAREGIRSLARARGDARRRPWGDARRRAKVRWRRARLNHPSRPDDDDDERRRRRRERRERRARCTLRASTRPRSRSTTTTTTIVIVMISAPSGRRRDGAARRIRPGSRRFRPCSRRSPTPSFARFDARRRRRGRPIPWRRFEGSRGTGARDGWPTRREDARRSSARRSRRTRRWKSRGKGTVKVMRWRRVIRRDAMFDRGGTMTRRTPTTACSGC